MKTRVLITGVSGFVGSHLVDLLVRKRDVYDLYGIVRERSSLDKIAGHLEFIDLFNCDLISLSTVLKVIREVKPQHIYHLAGESSVKLSWEGAVSMVNSNIVGSLNLLEALRMAGARRTRVLLSCSSEEYGLAPQDRIPIGEDTPLKPVSPYGVSKAAVDMFGYQYYRSYGIQTIRIRAFNHTGPRRPPIYALSSFAKQVAEIERGVRQNEIYVGNLDVIRDYTDVRDTVRAYELAVQRCRPGEVYNVCSSKGYRMGDLLEDLVALSRINVTIVHDKSRARPVDVPIVIGDNSKFAKATSWAPQIPIRQTLQDLLDYWRGQLS